ncbi:unnamed protein product [Albugo candida]|uniref:Uncharacterized protein n=1 Tax=Albugo candida TaxID=65357 RepID=A0A024G2B2_9STRA|nr:unnamed protein product [Albugo candida]|eukprot:CCI40438.1 unnamed protein product [Albugo candida]
MPFSKKLYLFDRILGTRTQRGKPNFDIEDLYALRNMGNEHFILDSEFLQFVIFSTGDLFSRPIGTVILSATFSNDKQRSHERKQLLRITYLRHPKCYQAYMNTRKLAASTRQTEADLHTQIRNSSRQEL